MVIIDFFGSMRGVTGKNREEVAVPEGSTVYELLKTLSGAYGSAFRDEIFLPDGASLRDDISITVNHNVALGPDLDTIKISDGDNVALLPLFPGGG